MNFATQALLVALGGGVGSFLRFSLVSLSKLINFSSPWPILIINILGSFGLGILLGFLEGKPNEKLWLFAGFGVFGGFTTFSTFSVENMQLLKSGQYGLAFIHLALSFILCVGAAFAGFAMAKT